MVRNHFTHVRWLSYFLPTRNKVKILKCNLILIYVMFWKISWMRKGRSSWKYFIWKGMNFLWSVLWMILIPFTYTLIFPVISTAIATWFPRTLFPVGLWYYTCLTCFGTFPPLSPFLSIVKMTTVDSLH